MAQTLASVSAPGREIVTTVSRCPWPVHAWGRSICRNEPRTRCSRAHQGGFPNHGLESPKVHGTHQNHGFDSDFVQIASNSCELFSLVFIGCGNAMLWGDGNERLFLVSFRGPP